MQRLFDAQETVKRRVDNTPDIIGFDVTDVGESQFRGKFPSLLKSELPGFVIKCEGLKDIFMKRCVIGDERHVPGSGLSHIPSNRLEFLSQPIEPCQDISRCETLPRRWPSTDWGRKDDFG